MHVRNQSERLSAITGMHICDAEGCTTTAFVRTRMPEGFVVGPDGWSTVLRTTEGEEIHFCPDHPQKFLSERLSKTP